MHNHSYWALFLIGIISLIPTLAHANMANPWQSGDPVGEPVGVFKNLAIQHEVLNLDLRPVATGGDALISVTYVIENKSETVTSELFFVAPGLSKGEVTLDGVAINAQKVERPLPDAWKTSHNPPFDTGKGLAFTLRFEPGQHTINVNYLAEPSYDHNGGIYREAVVEYILAPARNWASFGTLEVNAKVPSEWTVKTTPTLAPQGRDALKGTFDKLPADSITIRARKDSGFRGTLATIFAPAAILFSLGLTVWIGWRRRNWFTKRSSNVASLMTSGLVMGCAIFTAILWIGGIWGGMSILEDHLISRSWSYGMGMYIVASMIFGPVAGVFGFTLGSVARRMYSGPHTPDAQL